MILRNNVNAAVRTIFFEDRLRSADSKASKVE